MREKFPQTMLFFLGSLAVFRAQFNELPIHPQLFNCKMASSDGHNAATTQRISALKFPAQGEIVLPGVLLKIHSDQRPVNEAVARIRPKLKRLIAPRRLQISRRQCSLDLQFQQITLTSRCRTQSQPRAVSAIMRTP
ncbi:MAG: hypothetical protein WCB14_20550 [Candidatus Acidiferrales bacterium]